MEDFLSHTFLENDVENFMWFAGWLIVGWVLRSWVADRLIGLVFRLFRNYTEGLKKERFTSQLSKPFKLTLFYIFLFLAFNHLHFPHSWELAPVEEFGIRKVLLRAFQLMFAFAIIRIVLGVISLIGEVLMEKAGKTETKQDDQLIPFVTEVVKIIVVIMIILIVLSSVFHLNIGSLIAGLGIGGLAIALAAKESLENLFGSFTIFLDKPFVVGDLVSVQGITGTIEKVGFRSTRIRTLEKSFVTVPNKMLVNAELDNLSMRTFRRVRFDIGVLYDTPADTIKAIVGDIQNYIDEHPNTNQDGEVHFMDFAASSLNIMVLYYIDTMDWSVFLQVKEEINFKIMEIVEARGGDFAFPTQTLHIDTFNANNTNPK
jgi:MscS family membrane protein